MKNKKQIGKKQDTSTKMLVFYLFYFQCMWYNGDVKTARKRGKCYEEVTV